MHYRLLGRTGLSLSEIGFGCASFWGKPIFDEAESIKLVHTAIDQGVTFFDTGSSYSGGHAEPRLGRALRGIPNKHALVIATKAGTRIGRWGRLYKDFSPAWIRESVETSLSHLGLDTIPLLQLHGPSCGDFTEELLSLLMQLRVEGKVQHFSVNSFNTSVIEHVMELPLFGAVMIDYNILRPERAGLITALAARGIGVLAGMALAGGLYTPQRFVIRGIQDIWYLLRAFKNHRAAMIRGRHYHFINHIKGWTGAQIALAWVLRNPNISCAVLGTTRLPHLLENLQASDRELDPEILDRIGKIRL